MNKTKIIQDKINEEYDKFEKKVKPLREKLEEERNKKQKLQFEKHKNIIYTKNYGKGYSVFKIIKSINEKGIFNYIQITIENKEDYSVNYIKTNKKISKSEFIKLISEEIKKK